MIVGFIVGLFPLCCPTWSLHLKDSFSFLRHYGKMLLTKKFEDETESNAI